MAIRDLLPDLKDRKSVPVHRDELDIFSRLQRDMNRVFDDFFRGGRFPTFSRERLFEPSIDVKETDTEYKIEAELPGMDDKDIDISISQGRLVIKGEKQHEHEEKKGSYHRVERSFGQFERQVPLPGDVDVDKVDASFKKGVLNISLPKTEEAKKDIKKIAIKST
jgi:HSP20 family protein